MRATPLAALGVAAYAVFLAATVPASFVAARVDAATRGTVRITDAMGTLWDGAGRAVVTPAGAPPVVLENLTWRFNPWRLIAAEASFAARFTVAHAAAELEAARGFGGWTLRQLAVRGEASQLAALSPFAAAMQPAGSFSLTAPALAWDGRALTGEALLEWRGASLGLSTVKPLGTYRAVLSAAGGPATIVVSTQEGALRITGKGVLDLPGSLRFTGEARPDAAQASALEPLLGLIGPRRADGAVGIDTALRLDGRAR